MYMYYMWISATFKCEFLVVYKYMYNTCICLYLCLCMYCIILYVLYCIILVDDADCQIHLVYKKYNLEQQASRLDVALIGM